MKKLKYPSKFLLPIMGLLMLLTFSLCDRTSPQNENDMGTPEVDIETPPVESDAAGRPNFGAFDFNTNLGFHEASWAYFKWLTSPSADDPNKLVFETFCYNADAIGPKMKQGDDIFLTQSVKDTKAHMMGGVRQADSDGILVDQNGRAVYTSMHIDPVYHQFIQDNKLYNTDALQNFPATTDFPQGAFSLKVAWKILGPNDNAEDFYTITAKMAKLKNNELGNIVLSDETEIDTVAMVGFHIALVVPGHPEFVWITFENKGNAPDNPGNLQYGDPIETDKNYTFLAAGTPVNVANKQKASKLKLDEATQILSPKTEVFRVFPYGNKVNPVDTTYMVDTTKFTFNDKTNLDHILSLNVINGDSLKGTVWENYHEIGAVWFNTANALTPNQSFQSDNVLLTGSRFLSNAVVETFTQDNMSRNQCFGCHNTLPINMPETNLIVDGKNVLTSHILVKNYIKKRQAQAGK